MSHHPIQPITKDENGTPRFKGNSIVRHLLDNGGIDMNAIARLDVPREDRVQFAQLIGYSLSGFSELHYVANADYDAAERMFDQGDNEKDARLAVAEGLLKTLREALKEPMASLFEVHPDDLDLGVKRG